MSDRPASTSVGRPSSSAAEAAHLDDAADGRRMLEGLDAAEADVVGAAVGAVDHGIGLAGQLVVQPAIDQPTDDRRLRAAALDHIVGEGRDPGPAR
jgi:hypothetical protein